MSGATVPGSTDAAWVRARAVEVLEAHWRRPGFCVPNAATYPWQWLWDSCFHAVCWAHLGRPDRARLELANALSQQADDGFVPHMTYWSGSGQADDDTHAAFWGRSASSSITQPPMYGHAVAELLRLGVELDDQLVDRARRGLHFLIERRHRPGVGPIIVHPWESGCDDSPRWDAWAGHDVAGGHLSWDAAGWKRDKGELVAALVQAPGGSVVGSRRFEVAAAGFGALVAFNAGALSAATGDADLARATEHLVTWLDDRWHPQAGTWSDAVVVGPDSTRSVRTLDALLPVLVTRRAEAVEEVLAALVDPRAFGGVCGPAGVHRGEPAFDPTAYWRGPAWPQLTYLLWLAAVRRGREATAGALAATLLAGAHQSGFAEYWHPDTGQGLGAVPQSWTALAALVIPG